MRNWLTFAKELGFDTAACLSPEKLEAREAVRDMCAEDRCRAYNRSWTCPPACGTLEECESRMHSYQHGILLQTIGALSRSIDTKAYVATMAKHTELFIQFSNEIRKEFPDTLCLGAGSCQICEKCAYPDPCRFPAKAISSMEAYGLFVTQVCRDCDVPYYYGPKTIAYSACVLY